MSWRRPGVNRGAMHAREMTLCFAAASPLTNLPPPSTPAPPSGRARPSCSRACGIPDTLDGRFDALALHAALVIDRLRREPDGEALAQAFFDAMFRHLDLTLREIGVQDLGVGPAHQDHGRGLPRPGAGLSRGPGAAGRRRWRRSCAATPMAVGRLPTAPAVARLEAYVRHEADRLAGTARNDLIK